MPVFMGSAPFALDTYGTLNSVTPCVNDSSGYAVMSHPNNTFYSHIIFNHAGWFDAVNGDGLGYVGVGYLDGTDVVGIGVGTSGSISQFRATDLLLDTITVTLDGIGMVGFGNHIIQLDTSGSRYYFAVDHSNQYDLGSSGVPLHKPYFLMSTGSTTFIEEITVGDTFCDNLVTIFASPDRMSQRVYAPGGWPRTYGQILGTQNAYWTNVSTSGCSSEPNPGVEPYNALQVLYKANLGLLPIDQYFLDASAGTYLGRVYLPDSGEWVGYDQQAVSQGDGLAIYEVGEIYSSALPEHESLRDRFVTFQGSDVITLEDFTYYLAYDGILLSIPNERLCSGNPRLMRTWDVVDLNNYISTPTAYPTQWLNLHIDRDDTLRAIYNGASFLVSSGSVTKQFEAGPSQLINSQDGAFMEFNLDYDTGTPANPAYLNILDENGFTLLSYTQEDGQHVNNLFTWNDWVTTNMAPLSGSYFFGENCWQWGFTGSQTILNAKSHRIRAWDGGITGGTSGSNFNVVFDDVPGKIVSMCMVGNVLCAVGGMDFNSTDFPSGPPNHIGSVVPPFTSYTVDLTPGFIMYSGGGLTWGIDTFDNSSIIRFNKVKVLENIPGLEDGYYASWVQTGTEAFGVFTKDPLGYLSGAIGKVDIGASGGSLMIRLETGLTGEYFFDGAVHSPKDFTNYDMYPGYYLPLDFTPVTHDDDTVLAISTCRGNGVFVYPPIPRTALTFRGSYQDFLVDGWEFS